MSRTKTEINPKRAENVKKLIEAEKITQTKLADRIHMTQQNISRIVQMKQPLTEETARLIIEAFPESKYRIEWLLGYDEYMTQSDYFNYFVSKTEKTYNDTVSAVIALAKTAGIEVVLYQSGFIHANGSIEDDFIVRMNDTQTIVSYSELKGLIEDLTALTKLRLERIAKKKCQF